MDRITLERFRWPFAAARAAVFLAVLSVMAIIDPAGSVDSPAAASARPFPLLGSDIVMEVYDDVVFVAHEYWPRRELGGKLAWLRVHNPESRLVLRAHRDVSWGTVRGLFVAVRNAGFSRVTIETASFRTLLMRRADDPFRFPFDGSSVKTPPEEGMSFEIRGMWY